MDTVLRPPQAFQFENNLANVTSGNLSKEWEKWKKSFKIYYEACELSKKEKKVQLNILLHIIGDRCREVYDQFEEEFRSVDELLQKFDGVFLPRKNLTIERHKFFTREQRELESIEQYVFELNKMAAKCEFKDLCSDLVRDRLICGLKDGSLRERLLREADLTLSKATDICRLAEMSRAQAVHINTENSVHHVQEVNKDEAKQQASADVHWVNRGRNGQNSTTYYTRPSGNQVSQSRGRPSRGGANINTRSFSAQNYNNNMLCQRCGARHRRNECPAFGRQCNKCRRMNHFAKACRVFEVQEGLTDQVNNHNKYHRSCRSEEWLTELQINDKLLKFKLDTGADVNIIPKKYLRTIGLSESELVPTSIKLQGYSGSQIAVTGKCYLKVEHKKTVYFLKFIIVDEDSVPILSKYSCEELQLLKRVFSVSELSSDRNILDDFNDVFEGIGCLPGAYKIQLKEKVEPVIHPPRKLPVALKEQVKEKLIEMEKQGVITKVEGPTDWVNSMTVVKKPSGDIRICLDPRDLNKAIKREHFKLPTFEEVTTCLSGAAVFSTLDAKHSFWQVKLQDTDLCTFNTVFGRYKFLRMPFGICSASEIFHKKLYGHLDDLEGVIQFVDDILVFGPDRQSHDQRLRAVLQRCREINIKLNRQKCKIGMSEIKYLGHKISQKGISPDESHLLAIKEMPTPQNVKDVERFLGMVTYVGNFVPNLSEQTSILRELLKKDVEWHWEERHQKCFSNIKQLLTSPPVLQYYTLEKPITISVDASKNGLGACLMQDSLPVSYASRSLTKTEQSYAQIEKELYACVFACERFYTYIYGRSDVTIETDHKPLVSIINKPLVNAPPRLQRMLLRLQPYTFKLVYKPGKYLYIADTLSRAVALANDGAGDTHTQPRDYLHLQAQVCALSASNQLIDSHFLHIQKCTKQDEELQKLMKIIKLGWPTDKKELDNTLKPYWDYRDELTVNFGILWKGTRIIIPKCLRHEMMKKIHIGHLGIEKCRLRAREIIFWPNINTQLEDYLSNCQVCLTHRKQNTKEPLISHEIPTNPWQKVGADVFHFGGESYILLVDYFSKYIEVMKLQCLRSEEIISKMKRIFVRHGIAISVCTDNGPEFSSILFNQFAKEWNFQHITSSPRYPQSNGQVERAIQTIKNIMKKAHEDNTDFDLAYLEYLNTPISAEIPSPAELLFSRKLRTILPRAMTCYKPRVHNDIHQKLVNRQVQQKQYFDKGSRELKPLIVGQKVKVRVGNRWESGIVESKISSRSYIIRMCSGNVWRRNRKHIIIDSDKRIDLAPGYSSQFDDIPGGSRSSSIPTPASNSSNYRTRSGREVIPPDRWTYPRVVRVRRDP